MHYLMYSRASCAYVQQIMDEDKKINRQITYKLQIELACDILNSNQQPNN